MTRRKIYIRNELVVWRSDEVIHKTTDASDPAVSTGKTSTEE